MLPVGQRTVTACTQMESIARTVMHALSFTMLLAADVSPEETCP
jgi:hypothetical protein